MADDKLRAIVQRMVDAGEPEDAIASVIKRYGEVSSPPTMLTGAINERPLSEIDPKVGLPTAGALIGGAAMAPLTGGLSLPAVMLAEASGAGLGTLAGHAAQAATTGQASPDAFGDIVTNAALGAAGPLAGRAIGAGARLIRRTPDIALNVAEHIPVIGPPIRLARAANRLLSAGEQIAPEVSHAASAAPKAVDEIVSEVTAGSKLGPYRPPGARPAPMPPPEAQAPEGWRLGRGGPPPKIVPKESPSAAAAAPKAPPELPASWQQFAQAESKAATPAAAAPAPRGGRAARKYAKFAAEGDELSQSEREAIRQELEARGFTTKVNAADAARYRDQYGSLIPPGTKAARQGKYIQDAIQESRYRFLLDNPKAGLVGPLAAAALLEGLKPVPAHGGRP